MLHLSDRLQIENCVKCSHTVVPTDCTHLQIMKHTHTLTYNICMYAGMYMHIYQMAYKDCHSFVDNLSIKKRRENIMDFWQILTKYMRTIHFLCIFH